MDRKTVGETLTARAIAGLHVVFLAWDYTHGLPPSAGSDLLGFAIEREEFDANGDVVERYMLRGIKRFKHVDEGLEAGTPVPLDNHPVQSFQWGDYTAKSATRYRFTIIPVHGEPKFLRLAHDQAVAVTITTEAELGGDGAGGGTQHDMYFNRGVAASQAFVRRFKGKYIKNGKFIDDGDDPTTEPMVWLSRGLFEGLRDFVARAKDERFALRAMLYEFRYKPAADLFNEAVGRKVDVAVRYEAQSYREDNEATIKAARIKRVCKPQDSRSGIRHNKFIVLLKSGKPIAVWTGSTNISLGGIFGHFNTGHVVWDKTIAAAYLKYWTELAAADVDTTALRDVNNAPPMETPEGLPPKRTMFLFSPRDTANRKEPSTTLAWYASLIRKAGEVVCLTLPFNFDDALREAIAIDNKVLKMIVKDKALDDNEEEIVKADHDTLIAPGSKLDKGALKLFNKEYLTGFNRNNYIHNKFMLIDPHGEDPIVVTGSANFSGPSQKANDENMLIIRGDKRVAHVYFGEFLRVFEHHYARYLVDKINAAGAGDPDAGYLKEKTALWLDGHRRGYKLRRRGYFVNPQKTVAD